MRRILICVVVLLHLSCGDSSGRDPIEVPPEPKGNRLMGMDFLNPSAQGSYEDNLVIAGELGVDFTSFHCTWDSIETSQGIYQDPHGAFGSFDYLAKQGGIRLCLTIRPIDITGKTVPEDLASLAFDDPQMIARFNSMLDYVLSQIAPESLIGIQIGNEIDGYDTSQEPQGFWEDYRIFLSEINRHVDLNYPGLRVGTTVTLLGVVDPNVNLSGVFQAISDTVDYLAVTYYPQEGDFQVLPPSAVHGHLQTLCGLFPTATLYLTEAGYQSSSQCGSSQAMQARFFEELFIAWDTHQEQIPVVNFTRMHDLSEEEAQQMAGPYGISTQAFLEYLRTLGLRTNPGAGEDKPAMLVIKEQAGLRGW